MIKAPSLDWMGMNVAERFFIWEKTSRQNGQSPRLFEQNNRTVKVGQCQTAKRSNVVRNGPEFNRSGRAEQRGSSAFIDHAIERKSSDKITEEIP